MKFFDFLKILPMNLGVVYIYQTESHAQFSSGSEPIINLGAKLWNMVPVNIKSSELMNVFKSRIKY